MNRERAETCVLKITDSFAPDEPLRTTFITQFPSDASCVKNSWTRPPVNTWANSRRR